jgi:hypothetical protein
MSAPCLATRRWSAAGRVVTGKLEDGHARGELAQENEAGMAWATVPLELDLCSSRNQPRPLGTVGATEWEHSVPSISGTLHPR